MTLSPLRAGQLADQPHGFFGRSGGVSERPFAGLNTGPGSGDDPAAVEENRRLVAADLGTDRISTGHQIHSAIARYVDAPVGDHRPQGDGLVTDRPGLAIGVLTADCVPVLFSGHDVIGAAHAGWRGSLYGILEATVDLMAEVGAPPQTIRCAIGPSLRAPAFEVGDDLKHEVETIFADAGHYFEPREEAGKWTFDHIGFVRCRLESVGILPRHIEDVGGCTLSEPDRFFSYRHARQNGQSGYGRNLSAIMLKAS
ncbi:peptidoglycan editing factor PgeF [Parvularcula sp. LCG005]|uniref:peptidoglycan editing factor PgeF n=1 Tax=Parvularcula sp. LCG005 TaxID=3078805 RepID=UPI0029433ED1|nr:peptidoglycan editing factor PgeF [Parvularcula sp. LCG005]WOI54629.1 peptidoglycan editing factor PgeF [Parvularcula sp. LCG005]